MNRRTFLRLLTSASATGFLSSLTSSASGLSSKTQPNILFLFTDDQRFDTIHALGNDEIITPNMDRLARNGVSFTHAHIMGSMTGAVCMPSRAMLMSGRTLFHLMNAGTDIPSDHKTLPQALKEAGYKTFGTGKWHNGPRAYARSFTDGGKIFFGGMSNHLEVPVHDFDPAGSYPKEKRFRGKKFSSNLFSDEAIRFLSEYKFDQPLFMYISYTAPHDPRMAPEEYANMYSPDRIKLPENFMTEHPFDNGEMTIRDEKLAPFPRTSQIVREQMAAYYAMISHVDAQIGRVLGALEDAGHAHDTLIIFAGDNGLALGQHGLMGKQNLYEHSVRVPLIMGGPGVPSGETRDALCYLHDVFPTVCELTGIDIPGTVEGKSLVPILMVQEEKVRDSLFYAYKRVQRGVRTARWKLILYNVGGKQTRQVFDLKNDPREMNNLADDSAMGGRVEELTSLLKAWMQETGDTCDLHKPNWGINENSESSGN